MRDIRIAKTFALALVAAAVAGCQYNPPDPPERVDDDPKVLLMYDNIDSEWFEADVVEAGRAVAAGATVTGQKVVVFQRKIPGNEIYELVRDASQSEGFARRILKKYDRGEKSDLSKATIAAVVDDVRTLAPANHYGLAFGSHGMGWIPASYSGGYARKRTAGGEPPAHLLPLWEQGASAKTRFLARTLTEKIDVADFADALKEGKWDFLLMDDCFMSSVEALYDMRHVADYIIASPTEILSDGFPYDRVVKHLFTNWSDLGAVADAFVESYRTSQYPWATIAVVKCDEIEKLATCVKKIVHDPASTLDIDPVKQNIQFYEGLTNHVYWDMDEYIRRVTRNSALYREFAAQFDRTVPHTACTQRFYSKFGEGTHRIRHFSGLAIFIPWDGVAYLQPMYRNTAWYKAVWND